MIALDARRRKLSGSSLARSLELAAFHAAAVVDARLRGGRYGAASLRHCCGKRRWSLRHHLRQRSWMAAAFMRQNIVEMCGRLR